MDVAVRVGVAVKVGVAVRVGVAIRVGVAVGVGVGSGLQSPYMNGASPMHAATIAAIAPIIAAIIATLPGVSRPSNHFLNLPSRVGFCSEDSVFSSLAVLVFAISSIPLW